MATEPKGRIMNAHIPLILIALIVIIVPVELHVELSAELSGYGSIISG